MNFTISITLHYFASLFMHSFFLHRYGTHQQFVMTKFWERTFFVLTWVLQGPSFLDPVAYAKMHLEHHKHSDEPDDPHSPLNFSKVKWGLDFATAGPRMMLVTKRIFSQIVADKHVIARMYQDRTFPRWDVFVRIANSTICKIGMGAIYIFIYVLFAKGWQWIFLPVTILNGPVQGLIVNWCGHMWGYRNYTLPDNSRNTPILAVVMLGELYQNNHHYNPDNPNFGGSKWYEIDLLYPFIVIMCKLHIVSFKTKTLQ